MRDRDDELRLAEVLVETADTLADDFDAERYLRWLADRCVELLGARAAGVMYTGGNGSVRLVACSAQQELARELLAVQHRGGPCLETFGTRRAVPPVGTGPGAAGGRWPEFARRAGEHGVAGTYAVPMRWDGVVLGVLNVFAPEAPAEHRRDRAERELGIAQVLADAAAVGLHNQRTHFECRVLSEQLRTALDSRIRIEQAKGMLAERWNTGVDEAFDALRRYARREQQVIDRVAGLVINGVIDADALRPGRSGPW
ncbi:GAF and ANTAR domain-containing protein [Streptomyces sp. NPDC002564]|uniref:GAF and ANTAR domain-containing protein n=1 Tax=Streptomyces sp. NPDC002564 TaxID=3364649 RepID=UPI0036C44E43